MSLSRKYIEQPSLSSSSQSHRQRTGEVDEQSKNNGREIIQTLAEDFSVKRDYERGEHDRENYDLAIMQ